MNFSIKEQLKTYLIVLIFIALFSLYCPGVISVAKNPDYRVGNPINIIYVWQADGVPWTGIIILFVIMCILIIPVLVRFLWGSARNDTRGRKFRYSQSEVYGTAHFAQPEEYEEFAKIHPVDKCDGIILAQLDDGTGQKCIDFNPTSSQISKNIYVVGSSGSGKTHSFVKNYCLQAVKTRRSLIVTDPDGGLYRDMAGYFEDNGYVVRRLDLTDGGMPTTDGWDCMADLRRCDGVKQRNKVQIFAETVMSNISQGSKHDDIYYLGPKSLLEATLLLVLLDPNLPDDKKNIKEVIKVLTHPDGMQYITARFNETKKVKQQKPCLASLATFNSASEALRGNLLANLTSGLNTLTNENVSSMLSRDDMDLLRPGKEQCVYFCNFPDTQQTYAFVVSLFFSMIFSALIDYADNETPDGRLPVTVDFLCDELYSIGYIPELAEKMSTIRKRNINAVLITQDMTQLQQRYDSHWTSIISNCGVIISLGLNDSNTIKWFKERIGETTVQIMTDQVNALLRAERSSRGAGRRFLMSTDELFTMSKKESIIVFDSKQAVLSYKLPHTAHPEASKLRKLLRNAYPPFDAIEERNALRQAEKERLENYWKTRDRKPMQQFESRLLYKQRVDKEHARQAELLAEAKVRAELKKKNGSSAAASAPQQETQQQAIDNTPDAPVIDTASAETPKTTSEDAKKNNNELDGGNMVISKTPTSRPGRNAKQEKNNQKSTTPSNIDAYGNEQLEMDLDEQLNSFALTFMDAKENKGSTTENKQVPTAVSTVSAESTSGPASKAPAPVPEVPIVITTDEEHGTSPLPYPISKSAETEAPRKAPTPVATATYTPKTDTTTILPTLKQQPEVKAINPPPSPDDDDEAVNGSTTLPRNNKRAKLAQSNSARGKAIASNYNPYDR